MKAAIAVPAIALLVYRAHTKKSLTPAGIFAALLTAIAHAVHPWNLPFVLLVVFFLAGTRATHVKENVKATLTLHSRGTSGGEGPRNHVQVLANSLTASVFSLLHAYQLHLRQQALTTTPRPGADPAIGSLCFEWGGDLLVIGIIANYACVAADTFSSELGILSTGEPRLITSLTLRKVPRGTNGGVSLAGLLAGLLGSVIVVTASMLTLPLCTDDTVGRFAGGGSAPWSGDQRRALLLGLTLWGFLGSVVDSVLGGLFQRTVKDVRTGKVVEGEGGVRVLVADPHHHAQQEATSKSTAAVKAALLSGEGKHAVEQQGVSGAVEEGPAADRYDARNKNRRSSFGDEKPSRAVENGWDLLDNNDVNFLMAFGMSVGAMAVAGWYWGVPLRTALPW
ncbi:transmembrane protein 19 [Podospora conica]|nr:transmembrane protein 19 [Schizothecium conicum]